MDVGLVILPEAEIVDEFNLIVSILKEKFADIVQFSDLPNTPHLSLYQFRINFEHIESLKKEVLKLKCPSFSFRMDNHLTLSGQNIFWSSREARKNDDFRSFHEKIVKHFKYFRSHTPLSQINDRLDLLTSEQKNHVSDYGCYWGIPGLFDPHLTVLYQTSTPPEIKVILDKVLPEPTIFSFSKISIAKLGYHGNVEEIL